MTETQIQAFWQAHPCGESPVGGPRSSDDRAFEEFFSKYDEFRYSGCPQILQCLDGIPWGGRRVLEIGLGQGADSEQIIKRGAIWSGLDLTEESVKRVRTRMSIHNLAYADLKQGSALKNPYPDHTFDIVFSHGVLHHIPDIDQAQREIARVLKPGGELIAMLYAKWSLNYLVSIGILRRVGLLVAYLAGIKGQGKIVGHIRNARQQGLMSYLRMDNFVHANTDGPENPYSKVYDLEEVKRVFTAFEVTRVYKVFLNAPPVPLTVLRWLPGQSLFGWYLWVHLKRKENLD